MTKKQKFELLIEIRSSIDKLIRDHDFAYEILIARNLIQNEINSKYHRENMKYVKRLQKNETNS